MRQSDGLCSCRESMRKRFMLCYVILPRNQVAVQVLKRLVATCCFVIGMQNLANTNVRTEL